MAYAVLASVPLVALGACQTGVLHPQGPVGEAQKTILINSLVIMLAIVIPTIAATLGFAWWFRASNSRARYQPDWAYSGRVELVTWSIPILVVLFLGGIAWIGSHDLDPGKPLAGEAKPIEVQVVSLDWKWLFIYPDQGIASLNEVVVPKNTPIRFSLTSASVMNAFFVPQLGSMIYVMNGMTSRLNLQADREGEFAGLSSHFSGEGFAGMHFRLRSVDGGGFERWVAEAKGAKETLDRDAYVKLSGPSLNVAPALYRSVEPDLFDAIATQKIPPGPGPAPSVSPKTGG